MEIVKLLNPAQPRDSPIGTLFSYIQFSESSAICAWLRTFCGFVLFVLTLFFIQRMVIAIERENFYLMHIHILIDNLNHSCEYICSSNLTSFFPCLLCTGHRQRIQSWSRFCRTIVHLRLTAMSSNLQEQNKPTKNHTFFSFTAHAQ